MNKEIDASKVDSGVKTAYVRPQLVVYGDLGTITQAMAKTGADGATVKNNFSL